LASLDPNFEAVIWVNSDIRPISIQFLKEYYSFLKQIQNPNLSQHQSNNPKPKNNQNYPLISRQNNRLKHFSKPLAFKTHCCAACLAACPLLYPLAAAKRPPRPPLPAAAARPRHTALSHAGVAPRLTWLPSVSKMASSAFFQNLPIELALTIKHEHYWINR
jgi:hypothetical protein